MTRTLCLLLVLVLAPLDLSAQQPDAAKEERGDALLREIDARIHYPFRAGLEDLQFDWKVAAHGPVATALDGLHLRYSWKAPDLWLTGLVDQEGKTMDPPPALRDEAGEALLRDLARGLHAMARQVVIGQSFTRIYTDYDKEVSSREVNHKLEHRLTLTPRSKKRHVKIVMKVVDGLPRELRKTTAEGRTSITRLLFERRGKRDVLVGMKLEENNRLQLQEVFHYSKLGGIELVTGIDRYLNKQDAARLQRPPLERIRFERVRVNRGLTPAHFGVEEAPGESDAAPKKKASGDSDAAPKKEASGDSDAARKKG